MAISNPSPVQVISDVIGSLTTILLLFTPLPTFYTIFSSSSVEDFSSLPYLATMMSFAMWLIFNLRPFNLLMTSIYSIGIMFEAFWTALFYRFSPQALRRQIRWNLAAEFVAVLVVIAIFIVGGEEKSHGVQRFIGVMCILACTYMYAVPLLTIRTVIRTRNVQYLPFLSSFGGLLNGVAGIVSSVFADNIYSLIANCAGTILSIVQLILYFMYRHEQLLPLVGPNKENIRGRAAGANVENVVGRATGANEENATGRVVGPNVAGGTAGLNEENMVGRTEVTEVQELAAGRDEVTEVREVLEVTSVARETAGRTEVTEVQELPEVAAVVREAAKGVVEMTEVQEVPAVVRETAVSRAEVTKVQEVLDEAAVARETAGRTQVTDVHELPEAAAVVGEAAKGEVEMTEVREVLAVVREAAVSGAKVIEVPEAAASGVKAPEA